MFMSTNWLVIAAVIFVSSSLLSIQRCSSGADNTAAYIEARCEQTVDEALSEHVEMTEANFDTILDQGMQDYEHSPEYEASIDAFLHMVILMVISAVGGIAFVVGGISRIFRKDD